MSKNCGNCKYAICKDYGYSNYTVEGTHINCLKSLNPEFPCDRGYKLPKELLFASQCSSFIQGDPVSVDVDQEQGALVNYSDDDEIRELLLKY